MEECRTHLTPWGYKQIYKELQEALPILDVREVDPSGVNNQMEYGNPPHVGRYVEPIEIKPEVVSTFINSTNVQDLTLEAEARYITFTSLLQSIPSHLLPRFHVYRVKPEDEYDNSGRRKYMRMRFVAILKSGFAYCTCALERNSGVPCRHFFAVLTRTPPGTHYFNILQFHFNWVSPQERRRASDREWITIEPSEHHQEEDGEGMGFTGHDQPHATDFQEARCQASAERTNPASPKLGWPNDADQDTLTIPQPLLHYSNSAARPSTLPQTPVSKVKVRRSPHKILKGRAYADMLSVLDSFMKLTPSGECITEMKDMLLSNIQQLENNRRIANCQDPLPPAVPISAVSTPAVESTILGESSAISRTAYESNVNPTPLDPLTMPRSGAKRVARIPSSGEQRWKKRKTRK